MPKGIVLCTSSNLYQVEINNKIYNCQARGRFKKEKISPLVGDYVEANITDEVKKQGIIEQILPRNNELARPKMANLTQLILVISMQMPKPDLLLLDKQLVFAKFAQINPIICFNKIDLEKEEIIKNITKIYENIGYQIIKTNAKEKIQIEKIKPFLQNQITAFAGNSGVGKSTLLNAIFESTLTQEGQISNKNKKGKNTTTTVTLYNYSNNSYIADTPGFATFEIAQIPSNEIDRYFIEFEEHISKCQYVGCNHIKEDKCGIKQAVSDGKITKQRYENYQKIYQEQKQKEEKRW